MKLFYQFAFMLTLPIVFSFSIFPSAASENKPSITVIGTGVATAAPDMAIVTVGVVREETTAREALDANNSAMQQILAEMKTMGVEDKDLQTSNFSIQPRYFYPKRKSNGEQPAPEITGYTVNNKLTVRIRKLETTGEILDKIVTLGANSSNGIRFTNDDRQSILQQARANAVRDAIAKANTLTATAGVRLGNILSINEQTTAPRPLQIQQARSLAVQEDIGSVPIAGGENEYRVSVTISWEIQQ